MPIRVIHGGPNQFAEGLSAAAEGAVGGFQGAQLVQQLVREAEEFQLMKDDYARTQERRALQDQHAAAREQRAAETHELGKADRERGIALQDEALGNAREDRAKGQATDEATGAHIAQQARALGIPRDQIEALTQMDHDKAMTILEKRQAEKHAHQGVQQALRYAERLYQTGGFGEPQMLDQGGAQGGGGGGAQGGGKPGAQAQGQAAGGAQGAMQPQPGPAETRLEGVQQLLALDPTAAPEVMRQLAKVATENAAREAELVNREQYADSIRQSILPLAQSNPDMFGVASVAAADYAAGYIDYATLHEQLGRANLVAQTTIESLEKEFTDPAMFIQALVARSALRDGGLSVQDYVKQMQALRLGIAGKSGQGGGPDPLAVQTKPGEGPLSLGDFKRLREENIREEQGTSFDPSSASNQSLLDFRAFQRARAQGHDVSELVGQIDGSDRKEWMEKALKKWKKEHEGEAVDQGVIKELTIDLYEEHLRKAAT